VLWRQRFVVQDCGNGITREILDRLHPAPAAATQRDDASHGGTFLKWQVVETGLRVYAFRQ
jgi:hypothetical protein